MGIVNVTPDSFSDGGRCLNPDAALRQAEGMVRDGAQVIDVGGESTRPGAVPVSEDEELRRVIPVIRRLAKRLRVTISIDTSKAEVARCALAEGASLVNDVSALRGDPGMAEMIARAGVPAILMHRRGTPQTMQRAPRYHDVVQEVKAFLQEASQRAQAVGIVRDRILIDPGLGFGKTAWHNLELLRHLDTFSALGYPVVLGPSRKSFIGGTLQLPVEERVEGTLACVAYGLLHGVAMVRVHDVRPTVRFITMWKTIAHAARRQHRSRGHGQTSPRRRRA
ncbi:MAG: dihydropteroate synthase [Omnitrophica WOR_2 bacterium RIFCSPLOWO2_02_FULL_63_16]|nr:MAG: dihydropteroate synthase [Omnitrophica WOR_2 bacterium GWA2_63_20]OGX17219.1 MAG: dihydropteroate synthase [Omnitrophica WOR_2 bacterium GWF2_63_9]OGX31104.1 MAG: dihydropteroate synthase [Omnitrophica WOR_2 bacterium RIFCSPHIGHO2_12_FULL_64_13]OGX35362.1 MAG: dihydropteroate synthase [Omnitrophica WOR_2 bacterium RIFCSPHIGHO2_02_FULL_63_39]OGX45917.1 MAG: dihydropteroate synthase [Omnitrophica WOR_2 bacterium RIFCSPLOWO2_02_FULL_63_16]OGX48603.1 MAG: dihydropteroate synthase [Omnitrop